MSQSPEPPPLHSVESVDALYTRVLTRGQRLRRERRAFVLTAGISVLLLAAAVPVALTNDDPAQLATTGQPSTTRRATTTTEFQYTLEPNPSAVTTTTTAAAPVVAGTTATTARRTQATTRTTAPRRRSATRTTARSTPTTARATTTAPPATTSTTVIPASNQASFCTGTAREPFVEHPVAFVRGGNVLLATAGEAVVLTTTGDASKPAWSPNGSQIVFARPGGLYTMAPTPGAVQTQLTGTSAGDTAPAWSPDGGRIAFVRAGNLFTAAAGGGQVRRVLDTEAPLNSPTWSPDSCDLAFTWKTWVLKARSRDGTGVSRVRIDASEPDWGAAGKLAVVTGGDLHLVNPSGSGYAPLGGTGGGRAPSWRGNGLELAYQAGDGLRTLPADGSATPALVPGTAPGDTDPAW